MKYLGIISFFLFLFCIVYIVFLQTYKKDVLEGMIVSSNSNFNLPKTVISNNIPNSILPNSITGSVINNSNPMTNMNSVDISNNSFLQNVALTNPSLNNAILTSSNVVNDPNAATSTNSSQDGGNNSSNTCDPNTMYSIKNVLQDKDGNIVVRYMDTCGKYYIYQYTQTLNSIGSGNVKSEPTTQPPQPPTQPPQQQQQQAVSFNVDSNVINDIVSNALKSYQEKSNPPPVVLPV